MVYNMNTEELIAERSRLVDMLDTLESIEAHHRASGNYAAEKRVHTTINFLIDLLAKVPEVTNLQDAIALYQGQEVAKYLLT